MMKERVSLRKNGQNAVFGHDQQILIIDLEFGAKLKEDDLAPYDAEDAKWCEKVLEEIEALEELDFDIEFNTLAKAAPLLFAQLKSDAEDDRDDIAAYLKEFDDGLSGYARDIARWCREELQKAKNRIHASFVFGLESNMQRSQRLAKYELYWGDAHLLKLELDHYLAVTAEDIQRVAGQYFDASNRTVLNVMPGTAPASEEK